MTKTIPLHSLVLCELAAALSGFAPHEVISLETVARQLVDAMRRQDLSHIIYGELRHRVALKLSLGERVVVHSHGLDHEHRRHLVAMASGQGASCFTIGQRIETGCGELIPPTADLKIIRPLPTTIESHLRQQGWQGITIIGDVHGDLEALQRAIAWARSRQHFMWFLGDVIDYGAETLATVDLVYQATMHGEAAMVLANHERKIARWLMRDSEHLHLSDGNRVTIDALQRLSGYERDRWVGRFRSLLAHATLSQEIGNITLIHAAAHPSLWGKTMDRSAIEHYALYGEANHNGGQYRRTHHWIDAVPKGKIVIVGHDVVSEYPLIVTGTGGGKTVFLDTGCGKGGYLSSADLRLTNDGLRLECFKRH